MYVVPPPFYSYAECRYSECQYSVLSAECHIDEYHYAILLNVVAAKILQWNPQRRSGR